MALDPKAEAALALHRFGLGPRAGSIAAIASDPRGALIAELDRAGAGRIGTADLLTSGVAARAAFAFQQAQRAARQAERAAQQANAAGSGAPEMKAQSGPPPLAAPRPAAGPGLPQKRGLNENLAREILELHTLGVRTVYTQDDVTRFANVITGWTVVPFSQDPVRGGEFEFNPRMHEPGAQTVIGKSYPDAGLGQGRAVLAALARHPATARHVASKLARHFVADEPPPALVERMAKRFLATQGDLKETAKALVSAPEAWEAPRAKLKRPGEWVVGALRAVAAAPPDIGPVMQAHNLLGEPLWRPAAPKGFADESAPWLNGLAQRLDIANQFARRFGAGADPREAFEEALAPLASDETRQTITRAESRPQALALLFMAPEFQRR